MNICTDDTSRALDECARRTVDADRVATVRSLLPGPEAVEAVGLSFGLLSDPGRLRLLMALREGEMCVCDLAAACGLSESGVSHALRLLRAHGIVAVRRSGRRAYYRLADSHVQMLLSLALTHQAHHESRGTVSGLSRTRGVR